MGGKVFANGMEVSSKASPHKVLASMPDVALSPPAPPAGPVPIPYPNFAQSSDLTDGSKKVTISGKPITLKGKSSYKKSKGDEAATNNFGAGVISHKIGGPVKHKAGSFNVKVEGCNVVRTLDLTTGNHINSGNGCMMADAAGVYVSVEPTDDCKELDQQNKDAREELKDHTGDKALVGKDGKGKGKGTTVSSGKFTPAEGKGGGIATAHSNQKAVEKCPDRFVKGGSLGTNGTRASGASSIPGHTHGGPCLQKSGHTEARLFDHFGKVTEGKKINKGKMVFNIDWRPSKRTAKPSKMPCNDCHKMMCAAKAAGVDVKICGNDNKEREVPCDGTPKENQAKLRQSLGEKP